MFTQQLSARFCQLSPLVHAVHLAKGDPHISLGAHRAFSQDHRCGGMHALVHIVHLAKACIRKHASPTGTMQFAANLLFPPGQRQAANIKHP